VIEEAQAGVFVPPGDPDSLVEAVKEMASNREKCRKMGMNGRQMIESRFSRKRLAKEFNMLLENIRRRDG